MTRIEKDGKVYAIYDSLSTLEKGFKWYGTESDAIQVGRMCYGKDKIVKPHTHKYRPRTLDYTQESVIVVRGSVAFSFYDQNKLFLDRVILNPGDLIVSFGGYHGMEVLEDDTVIFEIKNGPFTGLEGEKEFMDIG